MKTFFRSLKITSISLGLLISAAIHLIGCSSDNKISDNKISDNKISDNEISGNEISGNELIELQKQNFELSKLADSLQKQLDFYNNSPTIKLDIARNYFKNGNYFLATKLSGEICAQFPNSSECKQSEKIVKQIEIGKDTRNKKEERFNNTSTKNESIESQEWYEGGTLHQAKIREWKSAIYRNKLATCSDFIARADNSVSMSTLKSRAENLVICIDEATRGLEITDNISVSEIAAQCTVLLKY